MVSDFLKKRIKGDRKYGPSKVADILELLISDVPDAVKIRIWLKKHARPGIGKTLTIRDTTVACHDWEFELWMLHHSFCDYHPLTGWQSASNAIRRKHADKVAKLARELARVLEDEPNPYYPPVLYFFEDEPALKLIRAFKEKIARPILSGTGYSYTSTDKYERDGPPKYIDLEKSEPVYDTLGYQLIRRFGVSEPQLFSPLLCNLADFSEDRKREIKPDKRPTVPGVESRIFARELREHFKTFFSVVPYEVIASCVVLRFPDGEVQPNGDDIRKWLGKK